MAVTRADVDHGAAVGYPLVLPPGRVQIRLDGRADVVARALLVELFDAVMTTFR